MDSKLSHPTFMTTIHDECRYCGHDWHKHELWCPSWSSMLPARCRIAHTPFLRSVDCDRPEGKFEYECNYCSLRPTFLPYQIIRFEHPLCRKGFHRFESCGGGCCPISCRGCGVRGTLEIYRRQIEGEYGTRL